MVVDLVRLRAAENLAHWYFNGAAGDTGHHAQSYEPHNGGVFDEAASWRLHRTKHGALQQQAVRKLRTVEWSLEGIGVRERVVLRAGLDASESARAFSSPLAETQLRNAFRRPGSPACVLGLALMLPDVRAAHTRFLVAKKLDPFDASVVELLRFLEWEAGNAGEEHRKTIVTICAAANAELTHAVRAFAALVDHREKAEKDEREAEYQRVIRSTREALHASA